MRPVGATLLILALSAACAPTHSHAAKVAPICTPADRQLLGELRRMADSTQRSGARDVVVDTATTAELRRLLADTARVAELHRLTADTTWLAQMRPQIAEVQAEVARLSSCPTR